MAIRRQSQTILPSAARTATIVSGVYSAEEAICTDIVINVTLDPGTASVTPKVEGKDPLSGEFYTILTGAAIAATGITVLRIGKDITAAANVAANAMLPAEYRVTVTAADAESLTYSVSATHMVEN
jgi:hypothetical protein